MAPTRSRSPSGSARSLSTHVLNTLVVLVWAGLALRWIYFQPFYGSDDLAWLRHVVRGLRIAWTESSPYDHFRPVFASWWWLLQRAGLDSYRALGVVGWVMNLALVPVAAFAVIPYTQRDRAWLAATLVLVHPARAEHLFWNSAQIDLLCLLMSLLTIGLAARLGLQARIAWAPLGMLAMCTYLTTLTKELGLALPVIVAVLPSASRSNRARLGLASAVGAACAFAHTRVVLGGDLGRARRLVADAKFYNPVLYPARLLWPSNDSYRLQISRIAQGDSELILGCAVLVGLSVLGIALLYRHRSTPWAWCSAVLLVGGMLPWVVVSTDRSIGLGCVGEAVLLAEVVCSAPNHRIFPLLAAPCFTLIVAPLWFAAAALWTTSIAEGHSITQAANAYRRTHPVGLLLIGQPDRVRRSGFVLRPEDGDRCVESIVVLRTLGTSMPRGRLTKVDAGTLQVTPLGAAYLGCPENVPFPNARCVEPKGTVQFSRRAAIEARGLPPDCGPTVLGFWDGHLTLVR